MTAIVLGLVVLLCLLPTLIFIGFWRVLCRLQRGARITRASKRAGIDDPAITWGDVLEAYRDPQRSLFTPAEQHASSVPSSACPNCAAENAEFASFCQECCYSL